MARGGVNWPHRPIAPAAAHASLPVNLLGKLPMRPMKLLLAALALAAVPDSALADSPPLDWRGQVLVFNEAHCRHPAWGFSHSARDYRLARAMAATDKVTLDDDVLFAAAYLHDIAAFKPYEKPDLDHSDVAADLVGSILAPMGFPMNKLPRVQAAIREHMYYRTPTVPESLYLHDADALDWLGAIGAARIMALADPNGGQPDGPAVIPMLKENLRDVPARVLSPAGKALMPARRDLLAKWLETLSAETDGYKTL
ncbi:MAG: HD domain-containing protein [Novosphingobium sp.]|nr:HD domain-containing protein [Novosphingobium sp.]